MKRNTELCHRILLAVEDNPHPFSPAVWGKLVAIEGYSEEEIEYHIRLLEEEGLLYTKLVPTSLSWKGCEHLANLGRFVEGAGSIAELYHPKR